MLTMLSTYADHYRARYGSEDGATAVEYGIMVTLIAVVIIAAVWLIGNRLQASFETVADCLEDTTVSC